MVPLPGSQRRGRRVEIRGRFRHLRVTQRGLRRRQRCDVRLPFCFALGGRGLSVELQRHGECAKNGRDDERRPGDQCLIPCDELRYPIHRGVGPREHRESREMAANVGRELVGGAIPARRIFSESLQNDHVEVAVQSVREGTVGATTGARGLFVRDGAYDFRRRLPIQIVGEVVGEQFVQDHAKTVDVRRRRHAAAIHLLRTRVARRVRRARLREVVPIRARVAEHLGDSEIQKLHASGSIDENVARLQIAMDHQILVREENGLAHLARRGRVARRRRGRAPCTNE